jgi:hypothetical protein
MTTSERTHPIRVGIQITQQHATYEQIRRAWQAVDATTADTLFKGQLDKLDQYLEAGITHFICDARGPDYDLSPLEKLIAWRDSHGSGSS